MSHSFEYGPAGLLTRGFARGAPGGTARDAIVGRFCCHFASLTFSGDFESSNFESSIFGDSISDIAATTYSVNCLRANTNALVATFVFLPLPNVVRDTADVYVSSAAK